MTFGSSFGRTFSPTFQPKSQAAAAVASSYPIIEELTRKVNSSNSSLFPVIMPDTVNAGDLLIIIVGIDGSGSVLTTPNGWTLLAYEVSGSVGAVYVKVAAGDEDSSTVNIGINNSENGAAHTYRIKTGTWGGTLSDVEISSTIFTGKNPNPPSLTASWGAKKTLWIAAAGGDTGWTLAGSPTDFTDGTLDNGTGASVVSARREYETNATLDPSEFDVTNGSARGGVFTIAIEPSA